jgi:hypothetical protein
VAIPAPIYDTATIRDELEPYPDTIDLHPDLLEILCRVLCGVADTPSPGEPVTPVLPAVADIVLAQDLSSSFSDDLPNLQGDFVTALDADLAAAGAADVTFGIASFIDYPIDGFGSAGDFIYSTDTGLGDDPAVAQSALDGLVTGGGADTPEAQLVALQQLALRRDEFGFRDDAEGFIVLSTDAPFHVAGDFLGGGPNDNDTDLADGFGPNGEEDYPSLDQVAEALGSAALTPIFTVTADEIATYEDLVASLNAIDSRIGGAVVELSSDSSDLADAIVAGLGEATTGIDIA